MLAPLLAVLGSYSLKAARDEPKLASFFDFRSASLERRYGRLNSAHSKLLLSAATRPPLLLTGSIDEIVSLWISDDLVLEQTNIGHCFGVAASSSLDNFVGVFHVDSSSTVATLEAPSFEVWQMRFNHKVPRGLQIWKPLLGLSIFAALSSAEKFFCNCVLSTDSLALSSSISFFSFLFSPPLPSSTVA
ncbi:hypothetical protein RIF29_12816 [Crotalaria pallida]|uniref:Uncharacterized protein n=1 Tax=Crotalaria pallida TaxID=3830 RepID=A0AAN9P1K1_CROPI